MQTPPRRCSDYRVFTPQLRSIRYTTNRGDKTLKKYAFNLRRYFNATDLGYDVAVGQRLAPCFAFTMKGHPIGKTHEHAFTLYAQDPEVADMLRDSGVSKPGEILDHQRALHEPSQPYREP